MNQEAKTAQDKPVLNAESFQRLLAAAYMLQLHNDRRPSVQPIGAVHTSTFAAGAIVQQRTPSVMIRGPQLQADQPGAVPFVSLNNSDKFTGRTDQTWRAVEALAIAIIFCMMTGVSIHRLSARSGHTSLASTMLEQRNASHPSGPMPKLLASSQQPVVREPLANRLMAPKPILSAQDVVIRYQKHAVNLPGQAAKKPTSSPVQAQLLPPRSTTSNPGGRLAFGRDADMLAADTVVQYGADATMWMGKPKRAGLDRLGH